MGGSERVGAEPARAGRAFDQPPRGGKADVRRDGPAKEKRAVPRRRESAHPSGAEHPLGPSQLVMMRCGRQLGTKSPDSAKLRDHRESKEAALCSHQ